MSAIHRKSSSNENCKMGFGGSDGEDKLRPTASISKRFKLPRKVIFFHILICKLEQLVFDIGLELTLFLFSFLNSFSMTATQLIMPLSLGSYVQVCNWVKEWNLEISFNSYQM